MNNKIGIIQGRLLPKYQGRYQAFPVGIWQHEFKFAQGCGRDLIEVILAFKDADENPLLKEGGVEEVKSLIKQTGVSIQTICADYFMEAPLHSADENIVQVSQKTMLRLLDNAKNLGVTDIIVPCVDQSSLSDQGSVARFVENLTPCLKIAEKYNINLSLETDLAPQPFISLLNRFKSNHITVNYDIGNSAGLGYNCNEELDVYGSRITDIHIKDRVRDGGSVMLGEGNADFEGFFTKLRKFDYQGPFIMQAYRDDEGIEVFKKQLKWIKPFIEKLYQ